jgi:hypothetical protein
VSPVSVHVLIARSLQQILDGQQQKSNSISNLNMSTNSISSRTYSRFQPCFHSSVHRSRDPDRSGSRHETFNSSSTNVDGHACSHDHIKPATSNLYSHCALDVDLGVHSNSHVHSRGHSRAHRKSISRTQISIEHFNSL